MQERRRADHSDAAGSRVRLAADPVSVPGARRFVGDALRSWDLHELVDDTTLCVSELAGNAALHSASTFMDVEVRLHGTGVRLSVEDDAFESADAVAPRPTLLAVADGSWVEPATESGCRPARTSTCSRWCRPRRLCRRGGCSSVSRPAQGASPVSWTDWLNRQDVLGRRG